MTDILSTHKILEYLTDQEMIDLTVPNPKYYGNEKRGFSTKGIDPFIELWEQRDGKFYVPRNLLPHRRNLLDKREKGRKVQFTSSITPRSEEQAEGIRALASTTDGILEAGTGKGKTVMALAAVAKVGVTTLVLVHTTALLDQWSERIETFLNEEAGIVQGDTCDYKGRKIVIGMIQSIISKRYPDDFYTYFGLVISDEVHRVSAPTWSKAIGLFPAKRRWGLTATPERSDGLETIFHAHIGPIVHTIKGVDVKPEILPVYTDFYLNLGQDSHVRNKWTGDIQIAKLLTVLSEDVERNKLLVKLILQAATKERNMIVLGDRVKQLEWLKKVVDHNLKRLRHEDVLTAMYIGSTSREDRAWAEKNAQVIFATYPIAKEGLDIPRLDTEIFATPTANEITLSQSVGRLTRKQEGKKQPIVIDLVDSKVNIFRRFWGKRKKVYQQLSYPIRGE